jgi:hypothetical protein
MYRLALAAALMFASSAAVAQQQPLPLAPWLHNCMDSLDRPVPPELRDYMKGQQPQSASDKWHYCVHEWNRFHPHQTMPET